MSSITALSKKQATSVLRSLTIGYEVLSDRRDWCRGRAIRHEADKTQRTQRCAIGAIYNVQNTGVGHVNKVRAHHALNVAASELFDRSDIVKVNDYTPTASKKSMDNFQSWRDVRKAYRWAIKQVEAQLA